MILLLKNLFITLVLLLIKIDFAFDIPFEFSKISSDDSLIEILRLKNAKKTSGNSYVKMLQIAAVDSPDVLTNCFKFAITNNIFPDELKRADIIPIHKKNIALPKKVTICLYV